MSKRQRKRKRRLNWRVEGDGPMDLETSTELLASRRNLIAAQSNIDAGIDLTVLRADGSVIALQCKSWEPMDNVADEAMPEFGCKLLPFLLPRKHRVAIAGDLAEEFKSYAAHWGRPYAVRFFWWEIFNLAIRRFSLLPIGAAVTAWLRRRFGW
jgi:hypothetical protein